MTDRQESELLSAETAESDRMTVLVHEARPDELLAVLSSQPLEEKHVQLLLRRVDAPAQVLEAIAGNGKWTRSEPVRLALVTHAHTPRRQALALLRQLFAFDLVRVALHPSAPAEIRCIAEELVIERVKQLPVGEKLKLARRGPARVAGALLAEGHADVLPIVLQNPFLTEAQVVRVLWRTSIPPHVVVVIAEHPKWSVRYLVRLALVRNQHTPLAAALRFLPKILLQDLRDLARSGGVPAHLREHVRRELAKRSGVAR
jgi:hypothetical protein